AATATNDVVNSTSPIAASVIGRRAALNSCQLVFHAAPYNNGGKKIRKTIDGLSVITGKPGIRLITTPESTRIIGKGKRYFVLRIPKKVIPNKRMITRPMFSMV